MQYAVIRINGQQYLVKPGDKIAALGQIGTVDDVYPVKDVLLYKDEALEIGQPQVNQSVNLTIKAHQKGLKTVSATYKSKSRYRRVKGHRQMETIFEVAAGGTKIATKKAKPAPIKVSAKPAKKTTSQK